MSTRFGVLKLASLVVIAAAGFAPAKAEAQGNRGQLVQAVVRLNQAQLTFAKKLAEDPAFAGQFDQATSSGNYDAAASLAASVTGVPKSSIYVGRGASAGHDDHDAASAGTETTPTTPFRTAAFTVRPAKAMQTTGKICFRLIIAEGCIAW